MAATDGLSLRRGARARGDDRRAASRTRNHLGTGAARARACADAIGSGPVARRPPPFVPCAATWLSRARSWLEAEMVSARRPPAPRHTAPRVSMPTATLATTLAFRAAHPRSLRARARTETPSRARSLPRSPSAANAWVRYGVREESGSDGAFQETYGLDLGGTVGRETLTFPAGTSAVAFEIPRPLGIVFEDLGDGATTAVEIVPGSNAEAAGVRVGDVLRLVSAVAVGKSTVEVGTFQVEPSLGMRKQGSNRRAYFLADGRPFAAAMDAVVSNAELVDGVAAETVALLLSGRSDDSEFEPARVATPRGRLVTCG